MNPWPHQLKSVGAVMEALDDGARRVCLTGPTGCGKSLIVRLVAQAVLGRRRHVALYSNRKMLVDQLSDGLMDAGVYHGVRAAGHEDERDHPFQICSIQTEHQRTVKKGDWDLHATRPGDLAIFDEGHLHTGPTAQEIRRRHVEGGANTLDITATPLGMAEVCDKLIVAASKDECRQCGALVYAHHFGPDEPDLRDLQKQRRPENRDAADVEEVTEPQARKVMMSPTIFGRVWGHFERLNPEHKATLLFAPGVKESVWFAEQFTAKGVKAAHIDGQDVWVDGELHRSSRDLREEILDDSRKGQIKVICNRYVLREGIDCPWLGHGIFATVFGSLQTYLQSGGRLLRAYPGKESVTIQDHGGNWWRHGSLNEDHEWDLADTTIMAYAIRAERLREKREREPFLCPQCRRVWVCGTVCSPARGGCGYELKHVKRSRPVVASDGTMRELTGTIFKPRRVTQAPNGPYKWRVMLKRSKTEKGRRTFREAAALFAKENYWQWPDKTWPGMPTNERDWFLHVADVPPERLTSSANLVSQE